jgi:hypothetical protein
MAMIRFNLDLAIPQAVFNTIPNARKIAFRDEVRALKDFATKINAGQPNEEMSVKTSYHVCHHDEGQPCESEVDI